MRNFYFIKHLQLTKYKQIFLMTDILFRYVSVNKYVLWLMSTAKRWIFGDILIKWTNFFFANCANCCVPSRRPLTPIYSLRFHVLLFIGGSFLESFPKITDKKIFWALLYPEVITVIPCSNLFIVLASIS